MEFFWSFLVGALVLFGGAYLWWQHVEHRFTVVAPGEVYTSGAMPPARLRKVVERHGIRTVFDLRCPDEGAASIAAERRTLEEAGVCAVNLQSPQVPPDDLRDRYLDWIRDPAHRPALIHCNHGEGRAVLYGALWRIEGEGMDPEAARRRCRFFTTRGGSFDPKKSKGAYLRHYRRRES